MNLAPASGLSHTSMQDVQSHGAGRPTALCFAPPMPYYSANSTDTLLLLAGGRWSMLLLTDARMHLVLSASVTVLWLELACCSMPAAGLQLPVSTLVA